MKKALLITSLVAGIAMADVNVGSCVGCHGVNFEKVALGKSKVVSEMTAAEIETALNGYKDGTYGGPMKGIMKGQVTRLTEADIKEIGEKFGKKAETAEVTEKVETTEKVEETK